MRLGAVVSKSRKMAHRLRATATTGVDSAPASLAIVLVLHLWDTAVDVMVIEDFRVPTLKLVSTPAREQNQDK